MKSSIRIPISKLLWQIDILKSINHVEIICTELLIVQTEGKRSSADAVLRSAVTHLKGRLLILVRNNWVIISWSFCYAITCNRHRRHCFLSFKSIFGISTRCIEMLLENRVTSRLCQIISCPNQSCFIDSVLVLNRRQNASIILQIEATFILSFELLLSLGCLRSPSLDLILVRVSPHLEHAFRICICRTSKVPVAIIKERHIFLSSFRQIFECPLVRFWTHLESTKRAISIFKCGQLS